MFSLLIRIDDDAVLIVLTVGSKKSNLPCKNQVYQVP